MRINARIHVGGPSGPSFLAPMRIPEIKSSGLKALLRNIGAVA